MATTVNGTWSFDSANNGWKFTKDGDSTVIAILKGGAAGIEQSNAINSTNITVASEITTEDDGTTTTYTFTIAANVNLGDVNLMKVIDGDTNAVKLAATTTTPANDGSAFFRAKSDSATTAEYVQAKKGYYTVENNAATWHDATTDTLATITDLKAGAINGTNLTVEGSVITVNKEALDGQDVTLTPAEGQTFTLTTNATASSTTDQWNIVGNNLIYANTKKAGYAVDTDGGSKKIVYTAASTNDEINAAAKITVAFTEEVTSADLERDSSTYVGASGSGAVITLETGDKVQLNSYSDKIKTVTISNAGSAYSFENKVETQLSGVTKEVENGTATFTATQTPGYTTETTTTPGENGGAGTTVKVATAQAQKSDVEVAKITGLSTEDAAADAVTLENKTITIGKDALTTSTETKAVLTSDYSYTLALGADVVKNTDSNLNNQIEWRTGASNAAEYTQFDKARYTLSNKEISYTAETNTKTLATITGLNEGAVEEDGTITGVSVTKSTEEGKPKYTFQLTDQSVVGESDITVATTAENTVVALSIDRSATEEKKLPMSSTAVKNWAKAEVADTTAGGKTYTYTITTPAHYADGSDGKSVEYTAETTDTTVTIVGLKDGLTVDASGKILANTTEVGSINGTTVILKNGALNCENVTITTVERGQDTPTSTYTLQLDSDDSNIPTNSKATQAWAPDETNTKYNYVSTTLAYYAVKDGNITYTAKKEVTWVSISGDALKQTTGVTVTTSVSGSGDNTTITYTVNVPAGALNTAADGQTITVEKGELTGSNLAYDLKLTDSTVTRPAETPGWVEGTGDDAGKYFYRGTTADYYEKETDTDGATFTYKDQQVVDLITVTGLKASATTANLEVEKITDNEGKVTGYKVTVPSTELATTEGAVIAVAEGTDRDGGTLTNTISLTGVKTLGTVTQEWTYDTTKGIAKYQNVTSAYYEYNESDGSYTYVTQKKDDIFTISGLKKNATYNTTNIALNSGFITLNSDVLDLDTNSGTVTLTNGDNQSFKLALDTTTNGKKVSTVGLSQTAEDFSLNYDGSKDDGIVELKGKLTAGYQLDDDATEITYHDTQTVVVGTVSGLKQGTVDLDEYVDINTGTKRIQLKTGSLGEDKVTFAAAEDYANDAIVKLYKLELDASVNRNKAKEEKKWVISGSDSKPKTASYQSVIADAWTLIEDDLSVEYTAGSVKDTLVTVSGLSSKATVQDGKLGVWDKVRQGEAGNYTYSDGFIDDAVTVADTKDNGKYTITFNQLNTYTTEDGTTYTAAKTSVLDSTAGSVARIESGSDSYKLVAGTGHQRAVADTPNAGITQVGTIVNYHVDYTAGFTANTAGDTLTYEGAGAVNVITFTGIKTGATTLSPAAFEVATSSTSGGVSATVANPVFTLKDGAFGESNIEYNVSTGYGISLVTTGATGTTISADAPAPTIAWKERTGSAGTYDYISTVGVYYTYDSANKKYIYHAAVPTTLATVEGLATGLTVAGDSLKSGENVLVTVDSNNNIKLKAGAFANKDVTLTNGTAADGTAQAFVLANDDSTNIKSPAPKELNSTNAKWHAVTDDTKSAQYELEVTSGYNTTDNTKWTYTASTTKVLATLTGPADITVSEGAITGVSVDISDTSNKKIILNSEILPSTTDGQQMTLTLGTTDSDYAFKLDVDTTTEDKKVTKGAPAATQAWDDSKKADKEYSYVSTVGAHYTVTDNKVVTYKAAVPTTLLTVTGLKASLTADGATLKSDETVVATLGGTDNKVLTVKKDALPTTADAQVKITEGTDYTLALDPTALAATDETKIVESKWTTPEWNEDTAGSGIFNYVRTRPEGYEVSTDSKTITKRAAVARTDTAGILASITGLKTGADGSKISTTNIVVGGVITGKKIVLPKEVLGTTNIHLTKGGDDGYVMTLASDVTTEEETRNDWNIDTTNNVITFNKMNAAYYVSNTEGTSITYNRPETKEVYFTISGLRTNGLSVSTDASGVSTVIDDSTGKIVVKATYGANMANGKVIVYAGALDENPVTITGNTYNFALELGDDVTGAKVSGTPEWTADGTKSNLVATYSNGYLVGSDDSIKYYTSAGGKNTETVVTVSGLDTGKGTPANITNEGTVITVKKEALDTTNKTSVTVDSNSGYTLKLEDNYKDTYTNGSTWNYDTGTVNFEATIDAHFENDGDHTLKYVGAVNNGTFITITRLKSGLTNLHYKNNQILDNEGKVLVTFDKAKNKILLSQAILPTTDGNKVEITKATGDYAGYTLAFNETDGGFVDSDFAKLSETGTWTVDGITATYKARISAGYALSTDGKSISKSAATDKTLAVVTGVKSGLTNPNEHLTVSTVDGVNYITLDKDALNKTTVAIARSYGYKLKLADGVPDSDVATKNDLRFDSTGDSTTATYKTYKPAFYTVNASDELSIKYTAEATKSTLATVTGLKKGDGESEQENIENAVTVDTDNNNIVLGAAALDERNTVKLSSTAYKLQLAEGVDVPKQDGSHVTSVIKESGSTSATVKAEYTAGYVLSKDGKTVTRQAEKKYTNASNDNRDLLATIKGLKSDATNENHELTYSAIDSTVTVVAAALDKKTVTITGNNGIKLITANDVANTAVTYDGWNVSGTTAYYKTGNQYDYYKQDAKGNLGYYPPNFGTTQVTITGLKSGITQFKDGGLEVFGTTAGQTNTKGVEIKLINNVYHVVLSSNVMPDSPKNGAAVKLTDANGGATYVLDLKEGIDTPTQSDLALTLNGTTAKLTANFTDGYERTNDKSFVYRTEKTGEVLATITGLKSGSNVDLTSAISDGKIYLSPNHLSNSTVTLKNATGQNYALALTDEVNATEGKKAYKWFVSGNTATYRQIERAYYTLEGNSVKYHGEKLLDVMATVKGISANLVEETDAAGNSKLVTKTAVDGVAVGTDAISINDLGEIVLTKQAVIGKDITLTNGKGGTYTLKLKTGVTGADADKLNVNSVTKTEGWTISGTTATRTANVSEAGYTLASDAKSVVYTSTGTKNLFSIRGLKSGLTDEGGLIKSGGTEVVTVEGTTVKLKAGALSNTNVTIDNKAYSLSLDDDVVQKEPSAQNVWVTKGTTATYKVTTPAWYSYDKAKNIVQFHRALNGATMLTLSGNALKEDWGATENIVSDLPGVMIDTTNNKVVLSASVLKPTSGAGAVESGNKVTLSGTSTKDDVGNDAYSSYTLDFDIDVTQSVLSGTKAWRQAANSTSANYVEEYNAGYKLSSNGKTINYAVGGNTTTYATLNGLKKLASTAVDNGKNYKTLGTSEGIAVNAADEIEISSAFLDETNGYASNKVTLKNANGESYKLKLNDEDAAIPTDTTTVNAWVANTGGTTAYLKTITPEYYAVSNDNTLTHYAQKEHKTLATLTGLNSVTATNGAINGITTYEKVIGEGDKQETVTVIVLDESVLPAKATATNNGKQVKLNGTGYVLELGKDSSDNTKTAATPENTATSWSFKTNSNSISATLNASNTAGYVLSDDAKTITTATSSGSTNSAVVTVSGLNKDCTTNTTVFAGICTSDTTKASTNITLTKDMLGASNVTVNNQTYKLVLDDEVATEVKESTYWDISSNTSTSTLTFKSGKAKYYTYDEDKNVVTYNPPKEEKPQFVISGLASGLKVFEDEYSGESTFGTIDENGNKTSLVTLVDGSDGATYVTLKNAALPENPKNGAKITISSDKYKLALDTDVPVAEQDSTSWTVNGTTATLTGHVPAGYTLSNNDKTLTYSVEKTGKTAIVLATLTGIDSSVNAKEIEDLLNVNTDFDGNKITIPDKVLGTANLALKNGTGQKFTLELGTDVADKATDVIGWNKSGANALYQSYKTAYYTQKNDTSIAYTKAAAAMTWLTLTGLKSDFAVTNGLGATTSEYGTIDGVEVNTSDGTVVLSKDALQTSTTSGGSTTYTAPANNAKVTLKGTNDTRKIFADENITYSTYKIALADEGDEAVYGDTFTVTPTTNKATYTTSLGNGYIVAADGKSLTYTTGKENQTVVTITGLNLNLTPTQDEINTQKTAHSNYTDAQAKAAAVRVLQDAAISNYVSIADKEITLSAGILGTSGITLTQGKEPNGTATTYKLVLDSGVLTSKPADWTETWTVSGTTATLKRSHDAYYELNAAGTSVKYYAPSNVETLMTISGLKSGLKVEDGVINGINVDGSTVTLSEEALGTANVTLKNGSGQKYELAISGVDESPVETTEWTVSNGTAVYKTYNKDYYKLNDNKLGVTYGKPGAASITYVTVSGLAKDVTAADMDAATSDNKIITLTKDMLTTSGVTVKQGKDADGKVTAYELKLSTATGTNAIPKEKENVPGEWRISGTTATYVTYDKGFYTESNGNIIYTKDTTPVTLMTIKGLKSGLTAAQVTAGIAVSGNTVTLDKTVLGTTNVTLTQGKTAAGAATTYALGLKAAAETDGVTQNTTSTYEWAYSGTTATYKQSNTAYHTVTNNTTITYKAAGTTNVATITGLKSGLTTTESGNKITAIQGITVGTADASTGNTTITLAADALTTSTVKLTNGKDPEGTVAKYLLATSGVATEAAAEVSPEWVVSGTTATYRTAKPLYYRTETNGTTVTYVAPQNPVNLFTINGLAKDGATAAQFVAANTATTFANEDEKRKITIPSQAVGSTNITVSVTAAGKADAYQFDKYELAGLSAPGTYQWGDSSKNVAYAAHAEGFVVEGLKATYYKSDAKVAATIKVDRDNLNLSAVTPSGNNVFTLDQNILGTNKSVAITGEYGFNFGDFSNAAITGSAAADTITAAGTGLTISGGNADDSLTAGNASGTNYIYGGAGNDEINMTGNGSNLINGDAGTDTIVISGGGVNTVNGGADIDFITISGNGANIVYGGAGNDSLNVSGGGANKIYGDAGTDTILISGTGANTVYGGADNDSISVAATATNAENVIYGDAGNDTIDVAANGKFATINGGAGNDSISVATAVGEIYGGDGNDTIKVTASSGTITINGGKGNDDIDLGAVTAHFYYANGDGNDTVTAYTEGTDKFHLTSGTLGKAQLSNSNDDLVLTIGSGKVLLKGAGSSYTADGAKFSYYAGAVQSEISVSAATGSSSDLASSADLIYDDANFTTNDLTDLVNHSVDTHSINGLNPTQDLNDLNQNALLTFGKDDKQNK